MKKIVYIVETLDKGVGKHVIDLYKYFGKKEDFTVYVLYGEARSSTEYINVLKKSQNNCSIKNLKEKIGFNDIKAIFEIIKHLKEIKPDIVHCHSSKAGLSGRIAAKLCGVKTILYSPHAYFFLKHKNSKLKFKVFLFAEKVLSKLFTNKTITTSKGEDEVFVKHKIDKESKRMLIVHGINVPLVDKTYRDSVINKYNIKEPILLGCMARFDNQKNPLETIEIMKQVSENNSNVKCILWGNGVLYSEVEKLNNSYGNPVILAGETNEPDNVLSILDIYLTTSLYEGLPYTLLEALSLKLPIVATNVVGNNDCVVDGKNGYLYNVGNVKDAVQKINSIIQNNDFQKMRDSSFEIFKERYSTEIMMNKYKELYVGVKSE